MCNAKRTNNYITDKNQASETTENPDIGREHNFDPYKERVM